MKRSYKFLIVFLILTIITSAASAVVSALQINEIRKESNAAAASLIASVKEKYPDVSYREIAEILNDNTPDTEAEEQLKSYGIDLSSDWASIANRQNAAIAAAVGSVFCLITGILLSAVFLYYCRLRKLETKRLTSYVEAVNNKRYDLYPEENSEDEMSVLKNEIYKTTVTLRESSDNSLRDKQNLKDSLSDISHQLKTPLTSIIIMLDNILDDESMPDDVKLEFINDIRKSTGTISFLVQSILTLSKLDANSITFKQSAENLKKIADTAVKNTEILAEIKGVTVENLSDDITLICDFKWLSEAITNIVKNCIEHTQSGGKVSISAEKTGLCTKVTIEDNGAGISKKDLPHIFERFYKGSNSSNDSTGIGLALAKAIIEKSGGYITADSVQGKGTKFNIRFFNNTKQNPDAET